MKSVQVQSLVRSNQDSPSNITKRIMNTSNDKLQLQLFANNWENEKNEEETLTIK